MQPASPTDIPAANSYFPAEPCHRTSAKTHKADLTVGAPAHLIEHRYTKK